MKLSRICYVLACGALLAQQAGNPTAVARKALDLLLGQKFADLEQMFTPAYKTPQMHEGLTKLGTQIQSWGEVKSVGQPAVQAMGPVNVVTFPVEFATRNIDVRISVNANGQIGVPLLTPGQTPWQPPSYVKADSFHEKQVTIGDEWKLPGTLSLPNGTGPFPAVLLVHGAGPNDRDETVGATKIFRDIAGGLASRGIAVLRYEKRTRVYSAKMGGTSYTADDEVVEDAVSALAVLRSQPEVDKGKVFVAGHDLGGYFAPRIAFEDGKVAGVIIMGANAVSIEDLLVEQADAAKNLSPQQKAAVKAAAEKVKKLEASDEDGPTVLGLPVAYWVDLKGYDPMATLKKIGIPALVIQGERDFQIQMKDFNAWKQGLAGSKNVTAQSFPTLNHLFIAGEGESTEAEYRKPGHVAVEVIDLLTKFVKQ
ncbi:MAG TPA: alpha/beta fold hydrolase [Candidatus Limnocylindrales bacterium]|nr:alpha/beta fold hydrolase [Candidatus Limnocylindrales bacterium]